MTGDRQTMARNAAGVMSRAAIEALFAKRQDDIDNLDAQALAADYADDAVIESPFSGVHGKVEAAEGFAAFFRAFLDLKMTTEALIIDGNQVAQLMTAEGSNIGGLFGLPPSGRAFRLSAVFVYALKDGKIVHERRIYDFTGLLIQVGVLKAKPV